MGRKDDVQQAALRLFAEQGYHATTLDELGEAAGVTKSLLYHHFAAKAELFLAGVAPVLDGTDRLLAAYAGRAVPLAEADREQLLSDYLTLLAAHPEAVQCLVTDRPGRLDTGADDRWSAQQQALRGLLGGDPDDALAAAAIESLLRPVVAVGLGGPAGAQARATLARKVAAYAPPDDGVSSVDRLTRHEMTVLAFVLRLHLEGTDHCRGAELADLLTRRGGPHVALATVLACLGTLHNLGLLAAHRGRDRQLTVYSLTADGLALARKPTYRLAAADDPPDWADLASVATARL